MDMRMKIKLLAPAMQDAEETDLCAEVSGVARHFEKGFRTATKEEIVEELLVLQDQRRQAAGKGEDHMGVGRR